MRPMSNAKKKQKPGSSTIAQNRRARRDYFLEEKFEAGLVLAGWEVKALRAGRGQLCDIQQWRSLADGGTNSTSA